MVSRCAFTFPIMTLKGNILLLDDIQNNLGFLSTILIEQGYQIRSVVSAEIALKVAKATNPDVIVLESLMLERDGYQICEYLKSDPQTRNIPVIFLSILDQVPDRVKAFELGAGDYITNSCQVEEVISHIENQLTISKLQKQFIKQIEKLNEKNAQLQKEISDYKKHEKELKHFNQELIKANRELEQFAFIASHDLQQPLTTIDGLVQLLSRNYQESLDTKANGYLTRIRSGTIRMKNLIRDLLRYFRIGEQDEDFELIDCNNVLNLVRANLKEMIENNDAVITSDFLPTLMGNSSQITQLFHNIISNAIKFRQPEKPPRIEISVAKRNDQWLFRFRDYGIGIRPQYFEQIFELFQRLHNQHKYHGTGIGLPICRKIVECHGGRIWVESELGSGTTFYFTIPFIR